jgi:hypothetical protein
MLACVGRTLGGDAVMINCWDQPNVLRLPDAPACDLRYCMEQLESP